MMPILAEFDTTQAIVTIGSGVIVAVISVGGIIWAQGRRDGEKDSQVSHLVASLNKVAESLDRVAEITQGHGTDIAVNKEQIAVLNREVRDIKDATGITRAIHKKS